VPFGFRSSCPRVPHRITNFENRALVFPQTVEAATASRMTSTTGFDAVTSGV
jgi:hypothetical protein